MLLEKHSNDCECCRITASPISSEADLLLPLEFRLAAYAYRCFNNHNRIINEQPTASESASKDIILSEIPEHT